MFRLWRCFDMICILLYLCQIDLCQGQIMIGFKSLPTNKRKLLLVLCRIWFGGTGSEYQQNGKIAERSVSNLFQNSQVCCGRLLVLADFSPTMLRAVYTKQLVGEGQDHRARISKN